MSGLSPEGRPGAAVIVPSDGIAAIRWQAAFDAMAEGLALHCLLYDAAGRPQDYRILAVNPAFQTHTGLAPQAVVGQLGSVVYGTGAAPFLERFARVADSGQPDVLEEYFAPLDRHFRIRVFSPQPGHFGTIFEDISERKRMDAALQRQRTMLARTERITHVGSWEWEVATDTVTWSDELFRIFQRDPAAGAPSYAEHPSLYAAEDMQRLAAAVEAALQQGTPYELELRIIRRDGVSRICLVHGEAHRDGEGRITHLMGSLQDITERKRSEFELERHRNHLSELVAQRTAALQQANDQLAHTQFAMDRAGIGIAWNDAQSGRFIYANDEICRQLGFSREELLTLTVSDINPEFPPRALDRLAAELRAGKGVTQIESLHRRKDGSTYPVSVTLYLHRTADTEWFIAFTHDISVRKAAEAELISARAAAEAASRAKRAFLANMSHEIRTPLNAVLGMTHLLRRDGVTQAQADCIAKIELAGEHLLAIINAILDLSKIEAGKLQLQSSDFAPQALLEEVRFLIIQAAEAKGLSVDLELDAALPQWVCGDVGRLRQALLNYANNAVKFTERGGILLRVRLLGADAAGLRVRFEVQDSGPGIAPEVLPRLFSPFEQGDMSSTRAHGGTGLGLAITRRLARLMGGETGAHSAPGQGSCFWLTARLGQASACVPTLAPPVADPAALLRADFGGYRVLVAEDDPVNLELSRLLLEAVGLVVDAAGDGIAVLEQARGGDYALVLMDLQMPKMDGLAATRALRQLPGWTERPILALTANALDADRRACLAAGMNDFLARPVKAADLYAMVLRWLQQSAAKDAVAGALTTASGVDAQGLVPLDLAAVGPDPATADPEPDAATADAAREIGIQLSALLSESDAAAIALCEGQAPLLKALLADDFGDFMHRIRTFELEGALEILACRLHRDPASPTA